MIRVVFIEDSTITRFGITTAINQQLGMEVVGATGTGNEGVELVQKFNPDVVLVDIGLPDISGVEVIKKIKDYRSSTKIVVLSCNHSQEIISAAVNNGAESYILKKNDIPLIIEAIKTTYNNKSLFDSEIIKRGLVKFFPNHKGRGRGRIFDDSLSEREISVLTLIAAGFSNKEIATKLFIGENTAKNHTRNIFSKLGVNKRINAVKKGCELGYISNSNNVAQVS
ncbi:response regulator transcription factor [Anabaena azotica]|uniref:Response regulator transcription factor n=1 Tax=Anabaena azotica FACHB-119 TaxID=947527 RepID=A0ABR8DDJ8_9NOST|nr:response regulator transcription factor [Anabaena azotica]MBD2505002.1 response regulator transcription factor [Anabaena azotica FACHB-119]